MAVHARLFPTRSSRCVGSSDWNIGTSNRAIRCNAAMCAVLNAEAREESTSTTPQNRTLCRDGHNHRRTQAQALRSKPYPGIFFGVFTDHHLSALKAFSSQAGFRVKP